MYRILVVEDNESLGYVLKEYLSMHNYSVQHAVSYGQALFLFRKQPFHLCLLDVMLSGADGFELAKEIKKLSPGIPIIFLTARALKVDKIKGFKLGADDYIVKPVDEEELLLRIESVLKRVFPVSYEQDKTFKVGKILFEYANRMIKCGDQQLFLSGKESAILAILCERKNHLVDRKYILQNVWKQTDYFTARTMDVHLTKLRKLLTIDSSIKIINVHGKGFLLADNEGLGIGK